MKTDIINTDIKNNLQKLAENVEQQTSRPMADGNRNNARKFRRQSQSQNRHRRAVYANGKLILDFRFWIVLEQFTKIECLKVMKTFRLLITFCFIFLAVNAEAQTKRYKKPYSKSARIKISKKSPRTISAGVINGKAINLVRPVYPKSAVAANVYGQVSIQVLIDENGSVISAKVNSGSPLLHSVSVKAALESKFEPITLSGEPVRVNGIILYKFILHDWNWLEIGFSLNNSWSNYYLLESLSETLPVGFEEERQILQQLPQTSENQNDFQNAIIASISGKLINNEKSNWLFSVGLILGQMTQNCCRIDEKTRESIEKLKISLQLKPANISADLISDLEKLISSGEKPKFKTYNPIEGSRFYETLTDLEAKFPNYN